MATVRNAVKLRLAEGKLAASFNLNRLRSVEAVQIAKACGFDWLFVDLEHSSMDLDTASQICMAALPTGITPIVRVPEMDVRMAARILDNGAQGVVFPHVETADQARAIVDACRFPPAGRRSLAYGGPLLEYEDLPLRRALRELDAETLIVVMLETPEAVARADEIASVDGIDVVMIGSSDLSATMGHPGEFRHPDLADAYDTVIRAARAHGKYAGMGGIYDESVMAQFIERGVRFLLGGADMSFIIAGARQRGRFIRSVEANLFAVETGN